MNTAFRHGYEASKWEGSNEEINPYTPYEPEWYDWLNGWFAGHEEQRNEKRKV
tara:strand:- start:34352 stop:34510 length:159 start_codon:yes stop_codon:yes gene_type:complete